ncbi:MAG: hypothetical protein UX87_C0004G0036 [Candidatus Amesbacteria bacterium GW2011_GWA1_47_16]|uniref:Glycosyltransferase RgtA/B/C/D-like domain-containing protein n=2 Tax=Candidatus Amesiibacteriota TaxID=1752730 RepID=A0A1F4Z0U8_9BACT|nr:MAG: hypothetical protein UX87_C0004G0036 [Candidatus Amesbacteria bacterium GW2011_GWA1_47_16]OGC99676.1 MAG: hypothetical protein A2972_04675 [Candidatus Amesbacteria bacterium RIFCSPLOWO2_01_FULL_47_33]OGD00474.1 MAG: hypothetical protein A2701_03825 [Candidatus Amesbacteria bacterium RIFCSPHIGHO2_01_FULL_47_34]
MKRSLTILLLITFLGLGLRLFRLADRPLGFTWDEAALGYNAFSLLKTGRDEHGQILPVVFKSFGDYKPGLYIYFTVPSVALLGLNEFAVRLPSALFGTLLIPVIFLLTYKLFKKLDIGNSFQISNFKFQIAFAAALLTAINPWMIHFSRGAWEANLALFLTCLAAIIFLSRRYTLSSVFFALTLLSYQGAKLFTPLLIASLVSVFGFPRSVKKAVLPASLFLLIILPIITNFPSQSGRLRIFNVLNYSRNADTISRILDQDGSSGKNLVYYLFHSESYERVKGITERYLNHFSGRFLFGEGDWSNLRHSVVYHGYFYYVEIIFILIGLIWLIRHPSRGSRLIFLWLLLAPLPSAFSRDVISGVRSFPLVIPLILISAIGLSRLAKKTLFVAVAFIALSLGLLYYFDLYFIHSPHFSAPAWLYPYKTAMEAVSKYGSNYRQVVFTDQLGQPYIYTLFYGREDPKNYQSQVSFLPDPGSDVGRVERFGRYRFRPIYWPVDRGMSSTLFVGGQYELPEQDLNMPNLERIGDVYYPDGTHALRIVGLK